MRNNLMETISKLAKEGNREKLFDIFKKWDTIAPNQIGKSSKLGYKFPDKAYALKDNEIRLYVEVLIKFESLTNERSENYFKILGLLTDLLLSDTSRQAILKKWGYAE